MRLLVAVLSSVLAFGAYGWLLARFGFELRSGWVELVGDVLPLVAGLLFLVAILNILLRHWSMVIVLSPLLFATAALFGPPSLSGSTGFAADARIDLVSFNTSCQNTQMASVEDWLRRIKADVIFLQELPETYASVRIANLIDVYPYQVREPFAFRDCGNMILSRHPLGKAEYIRLGGEDAAYWLQRATVFMSGKSIALYNVHLEKPISGVPPQLSSARKMTSAMLRYDPDRRNQQIDRLLKVLSEEELPSVVAGDFNMSEYSVMHSEMARSMHDAFRSAGTGFGATWPAETNSPVLAFLPPLLRIDYIWHNESLRTLEADVGPSLGSDHLPVRAKLQWRDRD